MRTNSILLWVLITHHSHRKRYGVLMEGQRALGKMDVELMHPDETTRQIDCLASAGIVK